MDALPPTNRTLDEMDAAARDMGIVPGDPAYALYTGLRRLYAEQRAELAQAINAIKAAQPKITGAILASVYRVGQKHVSGQCPQKCCIRS